MFHKLKKSTKYKQAFDGVFTSDSCLASDNWSWIAPNGVHDVVDAEASVPRHLANSCLGVALPLIRAKVN